MRNGSSHHLGQWLESGHGSRDVMKCPLCGKSDVHTTGGLIKHLSASGGHGLGLTEAEELAAGIAGGVVSEQPMPTATVDAVLAVLAGLPEASAAQFLRLLLVGLVSDKRLPKYQFERRFDCLLSPFLPDIVQWKLGGEASLVVPEFPLKKKGSNQSTNADYLVLLRRPEGSPDAWVLVELKTDSGSFSAKQALIYAAAAQDGWRRLRTDLDVIHAASADKVGYLELMRRVDAEGGESPPANVEVLYLTPSTAAPHNFHSVQFHELGELPVSQHQPVWDILRTLVLPELI